MQKLMAWNQVQGQGLAAVCGEVVLQKPDDSIRVSSYGKVPIEHNTSFVLLQNCLLSGLAV